MKTYHMDRGKTTSLHGCQTGPFYDKCHLPIIAQCPLFSPAFCFFPALFLSAPGNKSENIRVVWLGLPPFLAPASGRSWGQTSTNAICWPLELSFCGWKEKSSRAMPSRFTRGPLHALTAQKQYCTLFFWQLSFTINPNWVSKTTSHFQVF